MSTSNKPKKSEPADKRNEDATQSARFPTGSDLLDLVVGGGVGAGYPPGKIVNIVGDKSSGKTFLACELIAASYYHDHDMVKDRRIKWVYDDCESGFSFNTTSMYGIEIMPEQIAHRRRSATVEELYSNVRQFLEELNGSRGIYVVDSLDGLTSEETEERADDRYKAFRKGKDFDKGSYQMGKAKFLSQEFFPDIAERIERANALLVVISQVRTNVNPRSFIKWTRAGGKAMDFYAHTVLWLTTRAAIKRKARQVGVVIEAKTTKSKTARPFRSCLLTLLFDYGLDNLGSDIDFLYELRGEGGKLLQASEELIWDGGAKTVQAMRELIAEADLLQEFKEAVGSTPKKADYERWIESRDDLAELYAQRFGVTMSRGELIEYVDSHSLERMVTEKVVEKWESIEKAIRTDRTPKYRIRRGQPLTPSE